MKAISVVLIVFALAATASEPKMAPQHARTDERYKTDILLVIPHPDDDTIIAGYLARASFDEHRRIAVIFTTSASTGTNMIGSELGIAQGAEREIEARQALGFLGITNIWFLHGNSTTSSNVLLSLEGLDHGSLLGQVVRLIRLTRPEVILTFLPLPVAGENHSDHQAASVLATEAMDLAGDPSVFAEQLANVDNDDSEGRGIFNYEGIFLNRGLGYNGEGLHPWLAKKIYYFSDAFDADAIDAAEYPSPKFLQSPYRKNFLDGKGPAYSNTDVSPAKQVSYARLGAQETIFYLSQDTGRIGTEALARQDLKTFEFPTRFVLGKSLVGGAVTGNVFEGITADPIPSTRSSGTAGELPHNRVLELGGPWAFYREFWRSYALKRLLDLLPIPETVVSPGASVEIPLLIHNDTGAAEAVTLSSVLPSGWLEEARYSTFPLPSDSAYAVHRVLTIPNAIEPGWYEVMWKAEERDRQIGEASVRILVD